MANSLDSLAKTVDHETSGQNLNDLTESELVDM